MAKSSNPEKGSEDPHLLYIRGSIGQDCISAEPEADKGKNLELWE